MASDEIRKKATEYFQEHDCDLMSADDCFTAAYTQGRADAWRWISVSERLPEKESFEEVEFLTRDEVSGTSEVVRYECGERIDGEFIIGVTHWLPITLPGGEND